jgi:hypothetical protein
VPTRNGGHFHLAKALLPVGMLWIVDDLVALISPGKGHVPPPLNSDRSQLYEIFLGPYLQAFFRICPAFPLD